METASAPCRVLCESALPRLLCVHVARGNMLFLFLCITSLSNCYVFLWLGILDTIFTGYKLREENGAPSFTLTLNFSIDGLYFFLSPQFSPDGRKLIHSLLDKTQTNSLMS